MVTVKVKEETRKGPWTEEEDLQLACFVRLLGDRRWDFIAKVSGLNRTGKSCRLRWVNYLHPGLKRGRMTPQEERVVIELHSRWGNRWSRIARKLPGRTDNEIKNYWRTHMRKKAQERRRNTAAAAAYPAPSPSSSSSTSCLLDEPYWVELGPGTARIRAGAPAAPSVGEAAMGGVDVPVDQIWKEIAPADVIEPAPYGERLDDGLAACNLGMAASPPWGGYSYGSLWKMDDEDLGMFAAPCLAGGLSAPN